MRVGEVAKLREPSILQRRQSGMVVVRRRVLLLRLLLEGLLLLGLPGEAPKGSNARLLRRLLSLLLRLLGRLLLVGTTLSI